MLIEALPLQLPDDILANRGRLPLKPQPVTLNGSAFQLTPLDVSRDAVDLYVVSNGNSCRVGNYSTDSYDSDEKVWRFMGSGPFASLDAFSAFLGSVSDTKDCLAFCVRDRISGRPVGVTTYMSNVPAHLKIELGNIWYSPLVQRTAANTESVYLMLNHAFSLGYRRVEWKCHSLNERSRRAALRLGFRFEGIQESHLILKGRSRDTAWFRILCHEWPVVKSMLQDKLGVA